MKETKNKIISYRITEKISLQIEELSKKLKTSKAEIISMIIDRGLSNFFYESKDEIYEIVKDVEDLKARKVIISFLTLINFEKKESGETYLESINSISETNLSIDEFSDLIEKYSLEKYFQEIEIIDIKRMGKKKIDDFLKIGDENFKFENIPSEIIIKTQRKIEKEG